MKDSVFSGTPVQGNEVSRNPGHENEEFRNSAQEDRGDVFPGHFRKANPITEGAIRRQILLYFFPLLLSSFFQQLYNTADAVIVGQAAGKEALSAVAGSAGSVLGIFMMFYMGYASGAAVLAAQYFGARKKAALRAAVRISFITSAVLGLTGMLVCFGFAAPILTVMGTPADVYGHALQYLRIVSLGMVPNALYNMGAAALRAIGDVRRPLAILIITCLCNIGMDLLLVVFLGMGAPGAALATILCQLLSALLVLRCLRRAVFRQGALRSGSPNAPAPQAAPAQGGARRSAAENVPAPQMAAPPAVSAQGGARRSAAENSPAPQAASAQGGSGRRPVENTPSLTRRVLSMGLPLGLAEVMYTFANVVLMAVINGFGTDTTAAYAAYARIDAIFWMIVGSFGISITTFVGQNIGAGRWDRVMRSIRDCAVMMFVLLGGVLAVLYLFAAPLQSLFCRDPAVVAAGARMMRFLLPFYFLYIPVEIMYSALRGMGESLIPTLLTFFGVCLLRSAWGIFAVPLHRTVNMVLLGFPVTWAVTSVMFAIYFARYLRKRQQGNV